MKKLTKKLVIDYHEYMARKFHFEIINQQNNSWITVAVNTLNMMGIDDVEKFLDRWCLAIVDPFTDQKWVWLNYKIGHGNKWSLLNQVCLLAHETEHTIQGEDIRFMVRYATSKSHRAHYEALAIHPQLEIYYYLTGQKVSTGGIVSNLKHYRVRSRDIKVTKKHLDLYNRIVTKGAVGSESGKAAIRWLKPRV